MAHRQRWTRGKGTPIKLGQGAVARCSGLAPLNQISDNILHPGVGAIARGSGAVRDARLTRRAPGFLDVLQHTLNGPLEALQSRLPVPDNGYQFADLSLSGLQRTHESLEHLFR